MSSSDRLCECIKLNRNRSIEYFAESSSVIKTFHGNEQRKTRIPRDVAFFPRLANRWSIKRRRGQRRKRGFRPLLHSPLMRTVGALAEARRLDGITVVKRKLSSKRRRTATGVYRCISDRRANERICLPTQTRCDRLSLPRRANYIINSERL